MPYPEIQNNHNNTKRAFVSSTNKPGQTMAERERAGTSVDIRTAIDRWGPFQSPTPKIVDRDDWPCATASRWPVPKLALRIESPAIRPCVLLLESLPDATLKIPQEQESTTEKRIDLETGKLVREPNLVSGLSRGDWPQDVPCKRVFWADKEPFNSRISSVKSASLEDDRLLSWSVGWFSLFVSFSCSLVASLLSFLVVVPSCGILVVVAAVESAMCNLC